MIISGSLYELSMEEKNKSKKIKQILKRLIIFFLILNFAIFLTVCTSQSIGRPNAPAKAFMSAAMTVNILYIFPIYKVFGWNNFLAKPFYPIRNGLYNIGLNLLPPDDGEREMWWFGVKFKEYDDFGDKSLMIYLKKYNKYTPEQIKIFKAWTDEIYYNIEPFATMKINDKKFQKQRFGLLVAIIKGYIGGRHLLISQIGAQQNDNRRLFLNSPEEIKRLENILNIYLKSREYTQKYEPEGWDHFFNHTLRYYDDDLIQKNITENVIYSKLDKNQLSCKDPYIEIYGKSRANLKDYLYDKNLPLDDLNMLNWVIGWDSDDLRKLVDTCPANPYLQDLKSDIQYSKDIRAGKNPKNEYFDKLRSGNY